jgi:hypothetical protein
VLKRSSGKIFVASKYFYENHIDGSVLYPRPGTTCKINGKPKEVLNVYHNKITFKDEKVGINYPDSDLGVTFNQNQKPADRPLNKLIGIRELLGGSKTKVPIFSARILFSGISFDLGQYEDKVTAAEVYDVAAKFLMGEDAELNFPSKVKTAADLNLDLIRIIADTKSALGLTGPQFAAVLEGDFRDLREQVMQEQGVKVKAPDSPAWKFQTEMEELTKSSGKRARKSVQVFSPTFMNDKQMNELREAEGSQIAHVKKLQLGLLDPNEDTKFLDPRKAESPNKGKKLVFREESPSPDTSVEEEEGNSSPDKKQSVSERRQGKSAIKLEWFMDVKIGTEVEANWENTGSWYSGKIASIDWDSEVISVAYDDGDFEEDIDRTRVRVLVESDVYNDYLQKRRDIRKMRTQERKKVERERKKAEKERQKALNVGSKSKMPKSKKELTQKQIEKERRRAEEMLLQAEAAGITVNRDAPMTQRQLDSIKQRLLKHQKDEKERWAAIVRAEKKKPQKQKSKTREDFPDFEGEQEKLEATGSVFRNDKGHVQWPRRGAFVRVKYEKWYFGRVREIQKSVGRIVIEFDHGEVYAEEYPGTPEEDLVIISYTEYKKNRDKNLRINAQIRMLNESNGVLWGREGLKARNRIKQLLSREKNTLDSDSSDDDTRRQGLMGASRAAAGAMTSTSSQGANLLMMTANDIADEEPTKFKGVHKKGLSYIAKISYGSKTFNIGLFPTAEMAALAHDDVYFDMYGSEGCNQSFSEEVLISAVSPAKAMSEKSKGELAEERGLIGVTRLQNNDWRAAFAARSIASCDEDVIELGTYDTKEEAQRAYDQMCLGLRGQFAICNDMEMNMNIKNMIVEDRSEAEGVGTLGELGPVSEALHESSVEAWGQKRRTSSIDMETDKVVNMVVDIEEDMEDEDDEEEVISSKEGENYISTGVFKNPSGLWCARIIQDNQLYDLGSFETPQEASSSYENAKTFFARGRGAKASKKKIDRNTKAIHLSPTAISMSSPSIVSSSPALTGLGTGNSTSNYISLTNQNREEEVKKDLAEKDEQMRKMQMGMGMGMGAGMGIGIGSGQHTMAPEQQVSAVRMSNTAMGKKMPTNSNPNPSSSISSISSSSNSNSNSSSSSSSR